MSNVPVLNHVALTVDKAILEGDKREDLKDFLGEVFDWEEIRQLRIDGKRLVFRLYRRGQFLYLVSGGDTSVIGRADHFGIEVPDLATLEKMVGKAKDAPEKAPRR